MNFFGFFLDLGTIEVFKQLLLSALLGVTLGAERVFAHKTAGMRTYALVAMGSTLFIATSNLVIESYVGVASFDPIRMAGHIVTGIGFLGAGTIMLRHSHVQGLTTAAGLWVAAGIGIAVGFGLYAIAIFSSVLTLFIFTVLWFFEAYIKKVSGNWDERER